MHDQIIQTVKTFLEAHGVRFVFAKQKDAGVTDLIMMLPYAPYLVAEAELFVDSFYEASSHCYQLKRAVLDLLRQEGINAGNFEGSYKSRLAAAGCGVYLKNTLICHADFGTRFAVEILSIDGVWAEPAKTNAVPSPPCTGCTLCEQACPTGALDGGVFLRTRCIRHWQDLPAEMPEDIAQAMGNRILGCDICQACCPMNRAVVTAPMPEGRKAFDTSKNWTELLLSGAKNAVPITERIGKNYLRKKRLLLLILNAIENSSAPEKSVLQELQNAEFPEVRTKAQQLTQKFGIDAENG